jgi:hypothetical protein
MMLMAVGSVRKRMLAEIVKWLSSILPKSKTLNEKLNGD